MTYIVKLKTTATKAVETLEPLVEGAEPQTESVNVYSLNRVAPATDTEEKAVEILKEEDALTREKLINKIAILQPRLDELNEALKEINVIEGIK